MGLRYYFLVFGSEHFSEKHSEWGEFGDFIGGIVNPSVGLVTIILLVLTLLSQQTELREQRKQMSKQSFEQTFFAWLDAYRQSVRDMTAVALIDGAKVTLKGLQVMEYMVEWDEDLAGMLQEIESDFSKSESEADKKNARKRLLQLDAAIWNSKSDDAREAGTTPERLAILLLKYVELQTQLRPREKQQYADIFQASLGSTELSFYFLSNSQLDQRHVLDLYSRHSFLYFLSPVNRPLIAALMRHGAHNFDEKVFDKSVLRDLREST
jgi:hypothetical protein